MLSHVGDLAQSLVVWATLAYFLGAIPMGLVVGRLRGVDLRGVGSGNIGATNAVRALGRAWGLFVFVLDLMKAFVPLQLAALPQHLGARPDAEQALAIVGLAVLLGHVFPVYLAFRGGKGVACAFGVFLALDPAAALLGGVLYGQAWLLTRVSAIGSLIGMTGIGGFVLLAARPWPLRALALATFTLIWFRHGSNLREIFAEAKERRRKRDTR